jgi:hypothetical protein
MRRETSHTDPPRPEQEQFIDFCRMLGQKTPAEYDPTGNI